MAVVRETFPGNFHFELLDDRLERGQAISGVGTRARCQGSNSATLFPT
jgi:hypothetical protein